MNSPSKHRPERLVGEHKLEQLIVADMGVGGILISREAEGTAVHASTGACALPFGGENRTSCIDPFPFHSELRNCFQ